MGSYLKVAAGATCLAAGVAAAYHGDYRPLSEMAVAAWGGLMARLGRAGERQMADDVNYLTMGEAAGRLGVRQLHVTRVFERGLLPPAKRIGRLRVIPEGDLPALDAALAKCRYPRDARDGQPAA